MQVLKGQDLVIQQLERKCAKKWDVKALGGTWKMSIQNLKCLWIICH